MRALALIAALSCAAAGAQPRNVNVGGQGGNLNVPLSNGVVFRLLPTVATTDECAGAAITGTHGEAITVSRASSAYCTKSDGTLVSIASNLPRVESAGLLVEASATNVMLRSDAFDNASWSKGTSHPPTVTANAATAPDGTASAERVQLTANPTNESVLFQTITATAATYTCSAYVKGNGQSASIDLGIFQSTYSQSPCAYTSSGYTRCTFSRTLTAASATPYIGCEKQGVTTNCTGTPDVFIWGFQCEANAFATSYIATAGTSATRQADVASFAQPAGSSDTAGCVAVSVKSKGITGTPRVLGFGATNRIAVSAATTAAINDGTTNTTATVSDVTTGSRRLIATWSGSTQTITESGGTAGSGSYDGAILAATIYLGSDGSGNFLNGWLGNVQVGKTATGCAQ